MKKKRGRPKLPKKVEQLTLATFRDDITEFKQGLQDALEDEEYAGNKEAISKFLSLPAGHQNIFIVYLKLHRKASVTKIAEMLGCQRIDILRIVNNVKKELREE